jgi:hypothetical protein
MTIAKIDFHVVNEGMLEGAKKQVRDNTRVAKSTGQVHSRYMLYSKSDANNLVTVTLWNKRSAPDLYVSKVIEDIKKRNEPDPWKSIEGDEFDIDVLAENEADGDIAVAKIDDHIVAKGLESMSHAKIIVNTTIARNTGAVIHRYTMQSLKNPLRVITLTFWTRESAIDEFKENAIAASKQIGGDSPWTSIVGDTYDVEKLV